MKSGKKRKIPESDFLKRKSVPYHSAATYRVANRKKPDFDHEFDLVRGPVANDRVYVSLNMLESGLTDKKTVIKKLKTYVLADQILFHTAKSLLFLEYAGMETVLCK